MHPFKTREHFACTTDIALFRKGQGGPEVLLIKRAGEVEHGKWAMPGGHVDPEDRFDIDRAAARELHEETGVNVVQTPYPIHLRYLGYRDSVEREWIGHTYWGLLSSHHDLSDLQAADDASEHGWFTREGLAGLEVAFDHREILEQVFSLVEGIA